MRQFAFASSLILLWVSGCTSETKSEEETSTGDTEDGTETTEDTADTAVGDSHIVPVAVGFEFIGAILEDGTLSGFNLQGQWIDAGVWLTIADEEFFSLTSAEAQQGHYCSVWGPYQPPPLKTGYLENEAMDPSLGDEDDVELFASFEGRLDITGESTIAPCSSGILDPKEWGPAGEEVFNIFSGMRLGIGFGPNTEYVKGHWVEYVVKDYGDSMMTGYIAINHPDGTFVAHDWTSSAMAEWDPDTMEVIEDPKGLFGLQAIPLVDLIPGDPLPEGVIWSSAYWYQDFPLMDFSILKDDAPKF